MDGVFFQFEFIGDLVTEGSVTAQPPPGKQRPLPQRGGVIRAAKEAPKSSKCSHNRKTVGSQVRNVTPRHATSRRSREN